MSNRVKNILIPLAVTLGILVMLEVVSRIVLSRVYDRKFDASLFEKSKYGERTSGLKSNAEGIVWGKAFHTDDMGGRKQMKAKKGKPKQLVIGDSVTEGVGVEDSVTFVNILNETNDSLDIRNVSLIGWSYYDYRNALDSLLSQQRDIQSVRIFYCLNDIYGRAEPSSLPEMGHRRWVGRLNRLMQDKYATYKLIKLLVYQNSDKYFQYDAHFYESAYFVDRMASDFDQMQQDCKKNNVSLEVFILPYRSQVQNPQNNLPQRVLAKELGAKGVRFYDLLPILARLGDPKELYLFADEIHFSVKGHRVIADAVSGK